jgi:plasmid stability protein
MRTLIVRRLPDDIYQAFKDAAKHLDRSMESIARDLITYTANEYIQMNKSAIVTADKSEAHNGAETTS